MLLVVVIASILKRATPQASGSLDNVVAVEIPGQGSTMVALTFTLRNTSDKILYVHTLEGKLQSPSGESTADAVSAIDFDRYFQAFPALKSGAQPALPPETKTPTRRNHHSNHHRRLPDYPRHFNQRKSVSVVIWPYDQTVPIVLTKS